MEMDQRKAIIIGAGLAGTAAKVVFDGEVLGKRAVALLW